MKFVDVILLAMFLVYLCFLLMLVVFFSGSAHLA